MRDWARPLRGPREILARRVESEGPRGILQLSLIAAAMGALGYLILGGDRGVITMVSLYSQIRHLEKDTARLSEENRLMVKELARLRAGGSESLDLRVREVLGLVQDGEKVYRFVEEDAAGVAK